MYWVAISGCPYEAGATLLLTTSQENAIVEFEDMVFRRICIEHGPPEF